MRWDAARVASRRPLPKPRKMHGPVGDEALNFRVEPGCFGEKRWRRTADDACEDCGYHVCSCDHTTAIEALREYGVISEVGLYDELTRMYGPAPERGGAKCTCGRPDGAHETDCRALHEAVYADAKRAFTDKLDLVESIAKVEPLDQAAVIKLLTTGDWRDEDGKFPSQKPEESMTFQTPVGEIKVVRDPYVFGWHFYEPSVPHQFAELHPEFAGERDRGAQAREVVPALVPDDLTPADAGPDAELELRQPPSKP